MSAVNSRQLEDLKFKLFKVWNNLMKKKYFMLSDRIISIKKNS